MPKIIELLTQLNEPFSIEIKGAFLKLEKESNDTELNNLWAKITTFINKSSDSLSLGITTLPKPPRLTFEDEFLDKLEQYLYNNLHLLKKSHNMGAKVLSHDYLQQIAEELVSIQDRLEFKNYHKTYDALDDLNNVLSKFMLVLEGSGNTQSKPYEAACHVESCMNKLREHFIETHSASDHRAGFRIVKLQGMMRHLITVLGDKRDISPNFSPN